MLLPLARSSAAEVSLANHLALVACKGSGGSAYLVNELVRLVYVTYYVQEAGYGETDLLAYSRAEAALNRCHSRAETAGIWRIDPPDVPLFEEILRQADRQLERVPCHHLLDARERVEKFARSSLRSPLPTHLSASDSGSSNPAR